MPHIKECICNRGMTNSNEMELVIYGSSMELRCRKCTGIFGWWIGSIKRIRSTRRAWSEEECSSMR
jgi:hypothetical protein